MHYESVSEPLHEETPPGAVNIQVELHNTKMAKKSAFSRKDNYH